MTADTLERSSITATKAELGKYQMLARLGEGGMAEVFLVAARGPADFTKLLVAKVLRSSLAEDPEIVAMFMREAKIAARLNHPNLVQTYEVGRQGDGYCIIMEYLEGCSLSALRRRDKAAGALPLRLHLAIVAELLNGLHHAHELTGYGGEVLHLVHRDVTPNNVFITHSGHVKVLDFGLAKVRDSANQTQTGIIKGTVRYIAPEVILGETLDRRADVYATGVMLWEAITGQRLWQDVADVAIMHRVATGDVPSVRTVTPDAPEELDAICQRAMASDPADRYSSALELRTAIMDYLGSDSGSTTTALAQLVERHFGQERIARQTLVGQRLAALEAGATNPSMDDLPVLSDAASTLGTAASRARSQRSERSPRGKWWTVVGAAALASGAGLFALFRPAEASPVAADGRPKWDPEDSPSEIRQRPAGLSPSAIRSARAARAAGERDGVAQLVQVNINVLPKSAKVSFDGRELTENPASFQSARDGSKKIIIASAEGYITRTIDVRMVSDASVTLVLEREVDGGVERDIKPRASAPAKRPAETKPAAAPAQKAPQQPYPSLDRDDPWK